MPPLDVPPVADRPPSYATAYHTVFLERLFRETLPQPTIFTPILFQLLSEHVLKQKFKPKYA